MKQIIAIVFAAFSLSAMAADAPKVAVLVCSCMANKHSVKYALFK